MVGDYEGTDPPQHRDSGGFLLERGRYRLRPRVNLARNEICGARAVVPPRDQRLSVHVAARTAAGMRICPSTDLPMLRKSLTFDSGCRQTVPVAVHCPDELRMV